MQTSVYAPVDGIVEAISAPVGALVQSKDLLMRLRRAR